jgi:glycosyltransferase involved in cell wall biosynthesis
MIARHQDPQSMSEAIRTILAADATAQQMHDAALRDTQDASWPAVAEQYRALADRMVAIAA